MTSARSLGPIAIGGVGGSGTRIVAQIVNTTGVAIGEDLNQSADNLAYTFLFCRPEVLQLSSRALESRLQLFEKVMRQRKLSDQERGDVCRLAKTISIEGLATNPDWLRQRAAKLLNGHNDRNTADSHRTWGWKEPNTHIMLDKLTPIFPDLKYVHVIRNGLDMAFSNNLNQVRLWGPRMFGMEFNSPGPREALEYWVKSNSRALALGRAKECDFFELHFETLCAEPIRTVERLLDFIGIENAHDQAKKLSTRIHPPASIGRFRKHDLRNFNGNDIECVASMGFQTI